MVVRVFAIIACVLLMFSFCRVALGLSPLSTYDFLLYVSSYDVGFDEFVELTESLLKGTYLSMFHKWNSDLPFLTNLSLLLVSISQVFWTFVQDIIFTLFTTVVDIYRFAWNAIYLIAGLLGFVSL